MAIDVTAVAMHAEAIATIQRRGSWEIGDHVLGAVNSGGDVDEVLDYLVAQVDNKGGDLDRPTARWYFNTASAWPEEYRNGISMTAAAELLVGSRLAPAQRFAIAAEHGARLTKRKARELAGGTSDIGAKNASADAKAYNARRQLNDLDAVEAYVASVTEAELQQLERALSRRQGQQERLATHRVYGKDAVSADVLSDLRSALIAARSNIAKRLQAAQSVQGANPAMANSIARAARDVVTVAEWVESYFTGNASLDIDAALANLLSEEM